MKRNIVSKKTQRTLRKVSFALQAIILGLILIVGASDIDMMEFNDLVVVFGVTSAISVLLGVVAFFLNDVRRWYRIAIPTYAVIQAFKFNKLKSKKEPARVCGTLMNDHRLTYRELFYYTMDITDNTYGEPDNTYI